MSKFFKKSVQAFKGIKLGRGSCLLQSRKRKKGFQESWGGGALMRPLLFLLADCLTIVKLHGQKGIFVSHPANKGCVLPQQLRHVSCKGLKPCSVALYQLRYCIKQRIRPLSLRTAVSVYTQSGFPRTMAASQQSSCQGKSRIFCTFLQLG